MHRPWHEDDRPAWRVTSRYEVLRLGHGKINALELERQLAATGLARAPKVLIASGAATITVTLRAIDEVEAGAAVLGIIDAAATYVDGLTLGEPTTVPVAVPPLPAGSR